MHSTRSWNDVWTRQCEQLYYNGNEREHRDDGKNYVYFKKKIWMHQFTFTNNLRLFLNRVVAVFITDLLSVETDEEKLSSQENLFTNIFVTLKNFAKAFSLEDFGATVWLVQWIRR